MHPNELERQFIAFNSNRNLKSFLFLGISNKLRVCMVFHDVHNVLGKREERVTIKGNFANVFNFVGFQIK